MTPRSSINALKRHTCNWLQTFAFVGSHLVELGMLLNWSETIYIFLSYVPKETVDQSIKFLTLLNCELTWSKRLMLADKFRIFFSSGNSVVEFPVPNISFITVLKAFKTGDTVLATSFTTAVNVPLLIFTATTSSEKRMGPCAFTSLAKKPIKQTLYVILGQSSWYRGLKI